MQKSQNSLELLLKKANQSLMYVTDRPPIIFTRGEGSYLWDMEGNKYLDMIAGWAVNSLGHSSPIMVDAMKEQANLLINPSPAYYNQPAIEFANLLTEITCLDKVFFINSGAEANEGAIKLARKYGQKHLDGAFEIITAWNSFHGRTLAMMAASGKKRWDNLFAPKPEGFKRVKYNDISDLQKSITKNTCAIMLEPIQGEGGVVLPDKTYLKQVRELCDENNILLILDEVQTGLGRLGHMFAYEFYDIEPDILTLAKGIGGGFPLSALLAKDKVCCFDAGDQGGTYCSTPLATAVGKAVVEEIIKSDLCANAKLIGQYFSEKLNQLKEKYPIIKEIRGMGLLLAVEFKSELSSDLREECLKNFLMVNAPNSNTIRFMPALNLTIKEVDETIDILEKSLNGI